MTISSTGLISGLDTASIIDQLMAIEQKPVTAAQNRKELLGSQKTAFQDINAKLLSLKLSADAFVNTSTFGVKKATSSNPSVMSATANTAAPIGTYLFSVSRLVSTQQLVTRGFTDPDTTALGLDTTMKFESAAARLDREVELSDLNGFIGVQRGSVRITDRSGESADVDLSKAVTLSDVITAINNASGINVTASVEGDHLKLTDNTGSVVSNLIVANLGSTQTATSLGIAGNSAGGTTLTGSNINSIIGTTPLSVLNDGHGVRPAGTGQDDITITDGTSTFNVSFFGDTKISDVIASINGATGNTSVTASIASDGVSLQLSGAAGVTVTAVNGSKAGTDLGLIGSGGATYQGGRILAALNSKLLKNISNATVTAGQVRFQTVGGVDQTLDLSNASSFSDVVSTINNAAVGITAKINNSGNGLTLTAADGTDLTVSDTTGNLASSLHLSGTFTGGSAEGGDVDFAWVSENTRLASLNGGKGVKSGKFTLTDSAGVKSTVDLASITTLDDVISLINSRPTSITASINSTGDGLLLTDTAGGASKMTVAESGSSTAKDLGILGTDDDADGKIDGSYEKSVTIAAADTLQDVADKINSAAVGVGVTVINDGSASAPYRLSINSKASGSDGRILMDDGGLDLGASTLVKGSDAVVFFGSADPAQAVLLTSSTNSLTNTIQGVTIDLKGTSSDVASLSIGADNDAIVASVQKFVDSFNSVTSQINSLDSYNTDTQQSGLLLGDPTLGSIKSKLLRSILKQYSDVTSRYTRLTEIGITIGDKSQLQFNETKFREALATDSSAVQQLFSLKTQAAGQAEEIVPGVTIPASSASVTAKGIGATYQEILTRITDSVNGTLTTTTTGLDSQMALLDGRITQLNALLAAKRSRLETQFNNMELALAKLQSQQSSLSSLTALANG